MNTSSTAGLNKEACLQIIEQCAHPVGIEQLRSSDYVYTKELTDTFGRGVKHFQAAEYGMAALDFERAHQLLGLDSSTLSPASRNRLLCLHKDGRFNEAFVLYEPFFTGSKLYGGGLWNFGITALRSGKYEVAVSALSEWQTRPYEHLKAKSYLLMSVAFALLDKDADSAYSLSKALDLDPAGTRAKLERANVTIEPESSAEIIENISTARITKRLIELLEPRKPERYGFLSALSPADFRTISQSITYVEEDDLLSALASLEQCSDDLEAAIAKGCVEAAVKLLQGEADQAEQILKGITQEASLPGSVWWNFAISAIQLGRIDDCAARLRRCVQTEFATKGEAWIALFLAAILTRDFKTAKNAYINGWKRSYRTKSLFANVLADLPRDFVKALSISPGALAAGTDLDQSKFDNHILKSFVKENRNSDALNYIRAFAKEKVQELPEWESFPLEPNVITTVPGALIKENLQDKFRRAVELLASDASKDILEAVEIFQKLSEQFPRIRIIRANLLAALIKSGEYVDALEIGRRLLAGSAYHTRCSDAINVLCCFIHENRLLEAEALLQQERDSLGEARFQLYRALIAERDNQMRTLAEALYHFCTAVPEPSFLLLSLAAVKNSETRNFPCLQELLKKLAFDQPLKGVARFGSIRINPTKCRSHIDMSTAFKAFEKKADLAKAQEFFALVESIHERNFHKTNEKHGLVPLINAKIYLAKVNSRLGFLRSADECLKSALYLIKTARDRLDVGIEATLAENIASTYVEFAAPLRAAEALEISESANPKRIQAQHLRKTMILPHVDPEKLQGCISKTRNLVNAVIEEHDQTKLKELEQALSLLMRILNQAEESSVTALIAIICAIWKEEQTPDQMKVKQLTSNLDRIVSAISLHCPARSSDRAGELIQRLDDLVYETIEESTSPLCSISVVEAWHDGINASLVLECRSNLNRPTGPLSIKLDLGKTVQAVGENGLRLELESILPGQKYFYPIQLGIIKQWSAEEQLRIAFHIESGSEKAVKRRFNGFLTADFRLFEEPSVVYPGDSLNPSDLDGQPLYGRNEIVTRLVNSLSAKRQTRLYYLFGPRKVGKTSILKFVHDEVKKRAPGSLCVLVNLDRTWFNGSPVSHIANEILRTARLDSRFDMAGFSEPVPEKIEFLGDWLDAMKARTGIKQVILLLDEFWKLILFLKNNSAGDSFLGDLRHLWSGSQTISLLVADWHSREQLSDWVPAQFWADLDKIDINFLDDSACRQAIRGPATDSPVRFASEAVDRICYLTQGYPWHLQEISDFAVREAAKHLRNTVLKKDVDDAASKLLSEPRTFVRGLFMRDFISSLEEVVLWKLCRYLDNDWVTLPENLIISAEPNIEEQIQKDAITQLVLKSIVLPVGPRLKLASPLLQNWLKEQFASGLRVSDEPLPSNVTLPKLAGVVLEDDRKKQVSEIVEQVFDKKRHLRDVSTLKAIPFPFKFLDYSVEKKTLQNPVTSPEEWNSFMGCLQLCFVTDVIGQVDDLKGTAYNSLESILQQVRLRRNYVEHPEKPTHSAKAVELSHRNQDICSDKPSSPADWTKLQVGLLDRLRRALDVQAADLGNR